MIKYYLLILALSILASIHISFCQTGPEYEIIFTNNEVLTAELIGINPNVSYTIKNSAGEIKVINYEQVSKMELVSELNKEEKNQISSKKDSTTAKNDDLNKLKLSFAIDLYYQYNFNQQAQPTSFTEDHNSFSIGMANLIASKQFGRVGFTADLALGPRAEIANGNNGTTLSAIKQLFVTYSPVDELTLTAGNFSTYIGYELIEATENVNYSTSYLFSNGPFYHTGLKLVYSPIESLSFLLGVFDDTDEKFDKIEGKHFGTQIAYKKDKGCLNLNYLTGKDSTTTDGVNIGHHFDLTGSTLIGDHLKLGINLSYKINVAENLTDTKWYGGALYTNYIANELLTFGLRSEYLNDSDKIIFGQLNVEIIDFTFSTNINYRNLTLIPEFRIDLSNQPVFLNSENSLEQTSISILTALVYAF